MVRTGPPSCLAWPIFFIVQVTLLTSVCLFAYLQTGVRGSFTGITIISTCHRAIFPVPSKEGLYPVSDEARISAFLLVHSVGPTTIILGGVEWELKMKIWTMYLKILLLVWSPSPKKAWKVMLLKPIADWSLWSSNQPKPFNTPFSFHLAILSLLFMLQQTSLGMAISFFTSHPGTYWTLVMSQTLYNWVLPSLGVFSEYF